MEDDHNTSGLIWQEILIQAPVLLVGVAGFFISSRFWRKVPVASRWCQVAFLLVVFGSVLTIYGWLTQNLFIGNRVVILLRATTYLLFLIGVYAGRPDPLGSVGGVRTTLWRPVIELFRARPWLKTLFRTTFVSTFLLVFCWGVITTYIKPETFMATARLRWLGPLDYPSEASSTNRISAAIDPRFMQTECELIQSQSILGEVVENKKLNLNERWSARYNGGEPLTTSKVIALMQHCVEVRPIRNTRVIVIQAWGEKPEETADLANAIAETYCRQVAARTRTSAAYSKTKEPVALVEIIDRAMVNPIPVRPNKPLDIILAFWSGLWLSVLTGIIVVGLSLKYDKNRMPMPGSTPGVGPSQEWVTAQNALGAALRDQARRSDGLEALRLLDEAATAYRAVLAAGTRDSYPKGWAMAQNNLGVLLRDRAEWSPQELAVNLLREAVAAHRSALEFYTRKQHRHAWATTQTNLGIALRDQAKRSPGAESARLLAESVAACRAALET